MKYKQKEEAIRLRQLGYSYNEIVKLIQVSKGILSLWLRSIELTNEANQRLYERQKMSVHCGGFRVAWSNEQRKKLSATLKKYYTNLPADIKKQKRDFLLSTVMTASQLSFTIIEKNVKLSLDKLFNTDFKKEKVNNKIIDFANKKIVIEHTIDNGKGIRCALDRLNQVSDGRIKILICPSYGFGNKRKSEVVGLYHWPLDLFDKGIVPDALMKILNEN